MEFSGIFGALPDFIKSLGLSGTVIVSSLLFAALLVAACVRAGSSHFLFLRLWSILNGKSPIKDGVLTDFFEKKTALMQFRLFTGYRLRSLPVMHGVIEFSRKNGIDIGEMKACGSYFDPEALQLQEKLPARWAVAGNFSLLGLFLFLTIIGTILTVSNRPLLQFKEGDHRWFFYSKNVSVTTLRNSTHFDADDCKSRADEILNRTGWSKKDVQIACDFLQHPIRDKDFDNAVADQRWAAGLTILYGLFLSAFFWASSRAGYAARKLYRVLKKKNPTSEGPLPTKS
ncbi:hypothetical protein BCF11_2537 [Collimonas sp. PA-H2]|uniref:DUF6216 family protein n=1 Tax=Collimonas sp. PA-H2 TaxID=1881062 RepID=UPI000BF34942|nr:DUF6216 family protein [Collimonas sp. PA-H2]PFH10126.1 hypothetical protein BCF11_2537 [Collimonas sp. PA-H2]